MPHDMFSWTRVPLTSLIYSRATTCCLVDAKYFLYLAKYDVLEYMLEYSAGVRDVTPWSEMGDGLHVPRQWRITNAESPMRQPSCQTRLISTSSIFLVVEWISSAARQPSSGTWQISLHLCFLI